MTTLDLPTSPPAADGGGQPPSSVSRVRSLLLVAAIVGLGVLSVRAGFWKALLVIVALFVMIMLHELGHFVMARRAGMKATEFFVGFGPRLWSFRRGETEYGIKALPLGGYVKIIGMTNLEPVAPEDEERTYRQKGFWGRLGVAVAGSTVHMILALLLLFVLNAVVGNGLHARQLPVIETLSGIEGRPVPAAEAGLQVGDRFLSFDGVPITTFEDVRAYVRTRADTPIQVEYERDGRRATTTLTPIEAPVFAEPGAEAPTATRGFVGITSRGENPTVNPVQAVGRSATDFGMLFKGTGAALGKLLSFGGIQSYADQVTGKDVPEAEQGNRFLSPVGVYRVAGAAAEQGIAPVLLLLVLINIFVGIFNMLPLLPFDGGHVSIAVYEAVRSRIKGRRHFADVGKLMPVAYATVALLAVISLSALYIDIARPLKLS